MVFNEIALKLLQILKNQHDRPWVHFMDLHELLFGREQQGGAPSASMHMEKFREAHEHFQLMISISQNHETVKCKAQSNSLNFMCQEYYLCHGQLKADVIPVMK